MRATWEISFNTIQEKSPYAAKLLLICALLNNEDICEELLKRRIKLETQGMIIASSLFETVYITSLGIVILTPIMF